MVVLHGLPLLLLLPLPLLCARRHPARVLGRQHHERVGVVVELW